MEGRPLAYVASTISSSNELRRLKRMEIKIGSKTNLDGMSTHAWLKKANSKCKENCNHGFKTDHAIPLGCLCKEASFQTDLEKSLLENKGPWIMKQGGQGWF